MYCFKPANLKALDAINLSPVVRDPMWDMSRHRCVMSKSSQKLDIMWLHAMNFIIIGNTWGYHVPVVCFGHDFNLASRTYTRVYI